MNHAGETDAPWQWGTCFGGVNVPVHAVMEFLQAGGPNVCASVEHYLLLQLLVRAGSGMGGLV